MYRMQTERRLPGGNKLVVPCPAVVRDYQKWMSGVDLYDQLRLQRYLLQLAVAMKKYYKGLFLGLLYTALVNSYIVYRQTKRHESEKPVDHAKFLHRLQLQLQLLSVNPDDFAGSVSGAFVCAVCVLTLTLCGRVCTRSRAEQTFSMSTPGGANRASSPGVSRLSGDRGLAPAQPAAV